MAIPMMIMAGAAIAGPIIGGMMGSKAAKKDRAAAAAASAAAVAELRAIGVPPDLSKRIIMEEFVRQGVYQPDLEETIDLAASKVEMIQEDPALKEAQLGALSSMQEIGRTGFDAATEADMRASRMDIEEGIQGQLGQIQQQMAARGQAGSGSELAMKLQAAQEGERRASEESDRMAAMASQNALQAIAQSGQMAGNIRGQDFGVAQAKAGAADQFSLADWGAANARQTRNVGAQNQAQLTNLAEAQRIADTNVQMENTERQRMEQAKADFWDRKLQQAGAISGALTGQSQYHQKVGGEKAAGGAAIGTGIGQAGAAGMKAYSTPGK